MFDFKILIFFTAGRGLMATSQGSRNLLPVVTGCCPGDPSNSCPAAQSCFSAGQFLLLFIQTMMYK